MSFMKSKTGACMGLTNRIKIDK